ncbi:MAG TPA: zinc-binding alcohol dehydrogenase [Candidatus Hydrogenedentes bacterium]|nr:zinc-binding alcohol dehydrogenase [Candidatus Hydrogenedentota bacterium]HPG65402.1 zinc-binding alcohol dehydrogenase [Candidatus Hydrogenedentota bacterium]
MDAKALICDEQQRFTIEAVVLPDADARHLVVRTFYSGVSIGTEFALIRNKISWGPYPLCTGYQGVGVVEHAGAEVQGFSAGDIVYYRDNRQIAFADGRAVSAVSGTHCSHAVIEPGATHGVARLPEGVRHDCASLFVMPAVGLYGVDMANPRMGEAVVVYGVGPIGLGVVAACAHRGCVVMAVDIAEERLDVAGRLGADHVVNGARDDVAAAVERVRSGGADVVFEATGLPSCIDEAIALCRPLGKFVWQGNYGAEPVSMHFLPPHGKRLSMFFPCDDGLAPCRRAVLRNMASGALRWEETITHRVEFEDAPEFFDAVNHGDVQGVISPVIRWSAG